MKTVSASALEPAWFCLRVRPMREELAALLLRSRVSIEVFAPRLQLRRHHHLGRTRLVVEPLFPGYLFARFRFPDQVRHVLSTPGIRGIVTMAQRPREVDDAVVKALQEHVSASTAIDVCPFLEEGDWVRIVDGAFRNSEAKVVAVESRADRVRLLLDVLGRKVHVKVPVSNVVSERQLALRYPSTLLAQPTGTGSRETRLQLARN